MVRRPAATSSQRMKCGICGMWAATTPRGWPAASHALVVVPRRCRGHRRPSRRSTGAEHGVGRGWIISTMRLRRRVARGRRVGPTLPAGRPSRRTTGGIVDRLDRVLDRTTGDLPRPEEEAAGLGADDRWSATVQHGWAMGVGAGIPQRHPAWRPGRRRWGRRGRSACRGRGGQGGGADLVDRGSGDVGAPRRHASRATARRWARVGAPARRPAGWDGCGEDPPPSCSRTVTGIGQRLSRENIDQGIGTGRTLPERRSPASPTPDIANHSGSPGARCGPRRRR